MRFKIIFKVMSFLILLGLLYYEFTLIKVLKEEYKIRDNKRVEFLKEIDSVYKVREVGFYKKI